MSFMWMYAVARDIERLAGKEFYREYGQEVIDSLKDEFCPDSSVEEEWPEDEEIVAVINEVKEYHGLEQGLTVDELLADAQPRAQEGDFACGGVELGK